MTKSKTLVTITIVLALVLVGVIGYTTYARYVGQRQGTSPVEVAAWAVQVEGTAIGANTPAAFEKAITWAENDNVVAGQIAPGVTGTTNFSINPDGTEVALNYYIKVTPAAAIENPNITISSVKVGDDSLTMIPLGTCSVGDGANTTQATCEAASGTWSASADKYAGYYTGTIALPEGAIMTAAQTVTPKVTVAWADLNTDPANTDDTTTGITNASSTIAFDVVVEQKVGA